MIIMLQLLLMIQFPSRQVLHEPLHVTHIHMPGWWKEELAIVPEELLDVVSVVRQAAPSSEGPITVHCR